MLMLPPSCRIYLCPQPCDMRRGYDGLYAEVRRRCDESPLSGHLFIFMSRNRTRLKILFFADGGLCLYCKRLEKGTCSIRHLNELKALGETMELASKCGLGQSAPKAFLSIIEHFHDEVLGREPPHFAA